MVIVCCRFLSNCVHVLDIMVSTHLWPTRVLWSLPAFGRIHLWSGYPPIDYSVCASSLYGSDFHQSLSESYLTDSVTSSQSELQARAHVTSSEAAVFIQDIVQDLVDAMMAPSGEEIVHAILHGILDRELIDSGLLAAADVIPTSRISYALVPWTEIILAISFKGELERRH